MNASKLCKKVYKIVQKTVYKTSHDTLIQAIDETIREYPLCNIAQRAVTMLKKIIPHCDSKLLHNMNKRYGELQMRTYDYHPINTYQLPYVKLQIKVHKQITRSLLNGSPDIEETYQYFWSGKYRQEYDSIKSKHLLKLKEVAPISENLQRRQMSPITTKE